MDLGVRHIRTAGKGSGSIELTLPADLRELVGLPCRIVLRDGSRPDIVLQPDLSRARAAFAALWRELAATLLPGAATTWPASRFAFGLRPRSDDVPYLCWRDGLVLAAAAPHDPVAVARTLAALGRAMAAELAIAPPLAGGFGAACGYLVAGDLPLDDWQEACDLVAAALDGQGRPGAPLAAADDEGALGAAFWRHATPSLRATASLFQSWTQDPSRHAGLRAAWRRGRSMALSDS